MANTFRDCMAKLLRILPDCEAYECALEALDSGAIPPAGVGELSVSEEMPGLYRTVFTLTDLPIALVDEAGVVAYGSQKLIDFPEGVIVFQGASADLDITKSSAGVIDTWDGDIGVGTAAASNNATLTATEDNVLPSTATPQAVAGATTGDMVCTAAEVGVVVDGTSTAADLYLNVLVDDADHDVTTTPCNLIFNGTITVLWSWAGDN